METGQADNLSRRERVLVAVILGGFLLLALTLPAWYVPAERQRQEVIFAHQRGDHPRVVAVGEDYFDRNRFLPDAADVAWRLYDSLLRTSDPGAARDRDRLLAYDRLFSSSLPRWPVGPPAFLAAHGDFVRRAETPAGPADR